MELEYETNVSVAEFSQVGGVILGNVLPFKQYFPRVCIIQCTQYMQQGTFTSPGCSNYRYNFASTNGQVDTFENLEFTVFFMDVRYLQHVNKSIGMKRNFACFKATKFCWNGACYLPLNQVETLSLLVSKS